MTDQLALETGDPVFDDWIGITTVLGYTVWPGDVILKQAWKLGRQNVLLTSPEAMHRRTLGRELHGIAERLARDERPTVQSLAVDIRGLYESLRAWWNGRRPRVLATEISLRHPDLRITGRIDLVLECDRPGCGCGGRGVILVDLKTGPANQRSHLQVGGGYRLLWDGPGERPAELARRPMCAGEIVCVHATGDEATSAEVAARADGFMSALALYRDMARASEGLPEHGL